MLQYIINTTAIWLIGLLVFDLFLRNEANHGYNRFYLLAILFAGTLIPLWSWDYDSVIYSTGVSRPIAEQSAEVRQTIVAASESTVLGREQWLMIVYATGAGIFTLLLLRDVFSIVRLYRNGEKSKDGIWTVIETGKQQSPFSAFRYVFISSRNNYTEEELNMILAHEEQHGHMLHFIDVLLIRVANILFWFNPLIYIIEKRLLLVHEYQADKAVTNNPSTYGRFLVEQSVLSSAPVLAHSFIRSPLKKRILMLTRKTTTLAKGKQLLLLPVLAIAMLSFTENAFSQGGDKKKDGNKITYKGNVFETVAFPPDTMFAEDPVTGEIRMVITTRDIPDAVLRMNGETIYYTSPQNATLAMRSAENEIKTEIGKTLQKFSKQLGKGRYVYDLYNIIIDKKGRTVFYEMNGIEPYDNRYGHRDEAFKVPPIPEDLKKEIDEAIVKTLEKTKVEPLTVDGAKQIYSIRVQDSFTVL